ncbi:hypothetical protein BDN70DRAFT_654957 [Pholiota conissans]|uniref:DUF6533 domain-containing protein n=1 Tax=Pholiota conissans TaxID=109636 RepID=A0A9P5Z5V5_9AGAR|nr:hypothetical protein BDN70DRAFT_654957 [Pholiota conissans]
MDPTDEAEFLKLYRLNLIPLYVVRESISSLVWVLHDYFVTLEDEITYIWKQKACLSKIMFLWIRYYTIILVAFDTVQIHAFAIRGVTSRGLCVAIDPTTRIAGAISLWSIEIVMQLRIYVLFNRSKKMLFFNAGLFTISIGLFLWIMVVNAINRNKLIVNDLHIGLLGCPGVNGGSQWAQWIPATVFELTLFGFALYKGIMSNTIRIKIGNRLSLGAVIISENVIYFFSIACLLVFNNLMVVGATKIPWFGFGPFHAAIGIVTSRMLIHLRKFSYKNLEGGDDPHLPTLSISEPPTFRITVGEADGENIGTTIASHDVERAFPVIEST